MPDALLKTILSQARPSLAPVLGQWEEGGVVVGGLEGSARAFALATLWLAQPRTLLVVCPTLALAEAMHRDLAFFLGENPGPARLFPSYEVSPYREVDPPPEVVARRLALLWELIAGEEPLLVVTTARGLGSRLPPPEFLLDKSCLLKPQTALDRDQFVADLAGWGYTGVSLVEQVGDFAVRGGVVDFFGPLEGGPVRVEFFGDEVDSLRGFDPVDQRSLTPLSQAQVIPCQPLDQTEEAAARAITRLRDLAREEKLSTRHLQQLVERIRLRAPFAGWESYLPLYFENPPDLFAYLPQDAAHVLVEPAEVENRLEAEAEALAAEYGEAISEGRIVLAPPMIRRTPEQAAQRLDGRPLLSFRGLAVSHGGGGAPLVAMRSETFSGLHKELAASGEGSLLTRFADWAAERASRGRPVALVCRSHSQKERLTQLFAEREMAVDGGDAPAEDGPRPIISLLVGGLAGGFAPRETPVTFVTEDEVFGAPRVVRSQAPARLSAMLAALDDLVPGDLVVHLDHGIARYQGLITLAVGPAESDFLHLEFAGADKLYLPADRMGLISKYRGPGEGQPALDKLGSSKWLATKGRVQRAIEAIAQDLVELYAARSFQKGHAFPPPDRSYREFEAGFPFSETPDQEKAIEEVLADMERDRPMDRLICGDVGYGKTEVALRAAYLAAANGKQVALLAPTTVLVEQHFQTFAQRLAEEALAVESLSRFKSAPQQREVLKGILEGKVDIVVGTHRLLQKDVLFKDLGLIIIDEEHRFGVKDKERLKKLRRTVDVLALTATPIPRTLQMSLSGIRDLSVINTPPADRQAIKTYLAVFNPSSVREAIERELERGGQVFFVHNRVSDIGRIARMVTRLAPAARVGVAHGQQSERELEKVMLAFVRREVDVLVCTTIIESGLDIPNANTIVIDQAERLGLSQIYQLRGRVGRADQKAYAYLFIKSEQSLTSQAKKRLKALMDFTQLGAGFAIAMHDLEIRGGGNLLGEAQSGQVMEVGYELYVAMLEDAVIRLKGEEPAEGPDPEMNLSLPAHLPEEYLPDPEVRLNLYRRLSRVKEDAEVRAIAAELADRFGPLPDPAANLMSSISLKGLLRALGGVRLDLAEAGMVAHFSSGAALDLDRLMGLAEEKPRQVRVFQDGRVSYSFAPDESPFDQARGFLQYIGHDLN